MRTLQCDVDHGHTPAVLRKVSIAVARDHSYVQASRNLRDLAELTVSAKQCQRIETQAGVLQTYQSTPDPTPEVPECLKDPLWVVPKLNQIHRQHTPCDNDEEALQSSKSDQRVAFEQVADPPMDQSREATKSSRTQRWSGGDPLVKTVVATRRGYDHLGQAMAGEAFGRGFNLAKNKAFMGDGLKVNWSLWSRYFSHSTPITDLMHALSYVYAAAIVSRGRIEDGWSLYLVWLDRVWSGEVGRVIEALKEIAAEQDDIPEAVRRATTYLRNNGDRMRYAAYRRAGLPSTTSPVESTQKQINKRIKGTEKFWRDESLEPLLQLKADDLGETQNQHAFWHRRGSRNDGFRHRRRKSNSRNPNKPSHATTTVAGRSRQSKKNDPSGFPDRSFWVASQRFPARFYSH
jgi:hypothetical protein